MKIIQTFWGLSSAEKTIDVLGKSWLDAKYHLFSWILSCHSIRQFYDNIELVTDELGYNLLIEELKLPYPSSVCKDFSNINTQFPSEIWAINKMYSYSLYKEPFLSIDGDVFIWQPFPPALLEKPLIAQNIEIDNSQYIHTLQAIKNNCLNIPSFINELYLPHTSTIEASNAGIFGGNNWQFFNEYFLFALDFLNSNMQCLKLMKNINIVIEQYFFYELAKQKNIPISYLISQPTTATSAPHMANFTSIPYKKPYIHLMGGKKSPTICEQLEQRVRISFPDEYFKAINFLRNESKYQFSFFSSLEEEKKSILSIKQKDFFLPLENDPKIEFYRTYEILLNFNVDIEKLGSGKTIRSFIKAMEAFLNKNQENSLIPILEEVWSFELDRYKFIKKLPNLKWLESKKRINAEVVNRAAQTGFKNVKSKLNKYFNYFDSEWNWAEQADFKNQVDFFDGYIANLSKPPSYFRVIFFIYPQQSIIREYLSDPVCILLTDMLLETEILLIEQLIESTWSQILNLQPNLPIDYKDYILDRLCFLAYQGCIDFIEPMRNT